VKVASKASSIQITFSPPKSPPTPVSGYTATVASTTPKEVPIKIQADKAASAFPDVKCISGHFYNVSLVANYANAKLSEAVKDSKTCEE
jgi:hypothetical protein